MNKLNVHFFVLYACLLFIPFKLFALEDVIKIPKTGHMKPQISFTHKAHSEDYDIKCIQCHHKGKNQRCSECHKRRDQDNVINIKGAFHQQCHDCHRKTSGPRACGRCHVRKYN